MGVAMLGAIAVLAVAALVVVGSRRRTKSSVTNTSTMMDIDDAFSKDDGLDGWELNDAAKEAAAAHAAEKA